jgi:hypothetical protein
MRPIRMTFTSVTLVGVFAVGLLTPAYAAMAATPADVQREQAAFAAASTSTTVPTHVSTNPSLLVGRVQANKARLAAKELAHLRAVKLAAARAKAARYRAAHSAPSRSRTTIAFGTKAYSKWYAKAWISYKYKWGATQFGCLNALWSRESGWRTAAHNRSSGAYGIPQALPGRKMAVHGRDWRTNPETQIKWGVGYIKGRYGSACTAWQHHRNYGWY